MIYGSVCSGIEAATVAWEPLGWKPAFFAEIDPFACAVLQHRLGATRPRVMPEPTVHTKHKDRRAMMAAVRAVMRLEESGDVPNHGDFTAIAADAGPIDVLVGGTPCQSFSVAGLRKGLGDDRGNLALEFLRLAGRLRPRWVVWENVCGVLSSNRGRDFGAFLGGLAELGYGFAYRVLDAQYVRVGGFRRAVPQRRRRVFVVGHLGDWRRAVAVLFDRDSLSGNPPPRRESGEGVAGALTGSLGRRGGQPDGGDTAGHLIAFGGNNPGPIQVATACNAHGGTGRLDFESETFVAHTLRGDGFDASEDGTGRGTPLVACTLPASDGGASSGYHPVVPVAFSVDERQITSNVNRTTVGPDRPCGTLHEHPHAIAFQERGRPGDRTLEWQKGVAYSLNAPAGGGCRHEMNVAHRWAVRRLTPRECERLQGFPDDWTLVPHRGKPAADGPRYKAVGNSMAVNVMRWIGTRIELVEQVTRWA